MFEDTILVEERTAKRWSVPVSLTVELAGIGLLLLLPLIYGERLPLLANTKTLVYVPPLAHAPPLAESRTQPLTSPRVFDRDTIVAPVRIPQHPAILIDNPPAIPGSTLLATGRPTAGVPGIGVSDLLPKRDIPPPPTQRPVVVTPAAPRQPVRVSAGVQAAKRVAFVMPVYPPLARQARISGTVELVGVIATDGTIQSLRIIGGHPFLVKAAVDAVRQWRYEPTLLNGHPVEVIAPITVTFSLQ